MSTLRVLLCVCITASVQAQVAAPVDLGLDQLRANHLLRRLDRFVDVHDRDAIRNSILNQTHFLPNSRPLGPRVREDLEATMAEFVWLRFGRGLSEDYWAWRTDRGCTPYTLTELSAIQDMGDFDWKSWMGDENHEPTPLSCFVRASELAFGEKNGVPLRMAASPEGVICEVWVESTPGSPGAQYVGTKLPIDCWLSNVSRNTTGWWRPVHEPTELMAKFGNVTFAQYGMIVQFADRCLVPVHVGFFWDPYLAKWIPCDLSQPGGFCEAPILPW